MGFFVHNCCMGRNGHELAATCQLSCQLLKLANLSERFDELIKSAFPSSPHSQITERFDEILWYGPHAG